MKPGSKLRVLADKKYLTISVNKTFYTRVTTNAVAGMAKGMPVFRTNIEDLALGTYSPRVVGRVEL